MTLLTRAEYIRFRDDYALEQMKIRKADYETRADEKLTQARQLRKRMLKVSRYEREKLQPEYDDLMKEWAAYECGVGDIERDYRYIRWMKQQPGKVIRT